MMNQDYWLGVLSLPAAILGLAALWLAVKAASKVGELLFVGGLMRTTPSTPQARRTATASVVYGAKRSWMLAGGDVAVLLVVGKDGDRTREGSKLLNPPADLRTLRRRPISDSEY